MRVLITGEVTSGAARIAHALAGAGFEIAEEDAPFDVRLTVADAASERVELGELVIDVAARRVRRRGQPIWLTPIEFALVAFLIRARRFVGRDELLREVWGTTFDPQTNAVAVHVSRLRRKLGHGAIETGPDGYRITTR